MMLYFHQNHPIASKSPHAVPIGMAGVNLVLDMQSSVLAVIVPLLSVLPIIATFLNHVRRCEETSLHIRMRDLPPTVSGSSEAGTVAISN